MLNKTLLLFTLLFLSGCVERGFDLTVNKTIHTITATKTVDTRDTPNQNTKNDIKKMNTAVKKEQQKIMIDTKTLETSNTTTKPLSSKKEQLDKEKEAQKERDALLKKQALEQKKQLALAEKERKKLQDKVNAEKLAAEKLAAEKETEKLKANQIQEKKDAEKSLVLEKEAQLRKKAEEKLALKKKLASEKEAQARKDAKEKLALEHKISEQKRIQDEKQKKEKEALERKIEKQKKIAKKQQQAAEEKQKAYQEQIDKRNALHAGNTQKLIFKSSKQTYQKFGTSEIHGHVVYLTPAGKEIRLKATKVYLVPKNATTDYWYENFYLKNKESNSISKNVVRYINATHLNLEQNFAFYGLAKGTYYIIIESSYPSSIAKNKKVYIAKKINVEKYKKIMTVFSKKL